MTDNIKVMESTNVVDDVKLKEKMEDGAAKAAEQRSGSLTVMS